MDDDIARHDIARLEDRIEQLRQSIAWCEKIALAAKVAIGAGAVWFPLMLLSILQFSPAAFVAAVAALLGGVVLLGSNKTTWEQTEEALREAEVERSALIGGMGLRIVTDSPRTIH